METIKDLNKVRQELKEREKALSIDVYLLGEEEKKGKLQSIIKKRKKTEKMIFALIERV